MAFSERISSSHPSYRLGRGSLSALALGLMLTFACGSGDDGVPILEGVAAPAAGGQPGTGEATGGSDTGVGDPPAAGGMGPINVVGLGGSPPAASAGPGAGGETSSEGGTTGEGGATGEGGSGGNPTASFFRSCEAPEVADPVAEATGMNWPNGSAAYDAERESSATIWADFSSNDLGDWTTFNGVWAVGDGAWAIEEAEGKGVFTEGLANSVEWPKFCSAVIETDIRILSGDASANAGIVFAVTTAAAGADTYTGYYVGLQPGGGAIEQGQASFGWFPIGGSPIAGVPVELGEWHRLKVVTWDDATGLHWDVYLDGVKYVDNETTPTNQALRQGTVGVRSFNAGVEWDNFSVHVTSDETE